MFVLYISICEFSWRFGLDCSKAFCFSPWQRKTVRSAEWLLTFFWRRQWKMKINIPWKVLNMVKRYAITIEASLMKKSPKDQVRPSRHSRAKAPMTQDLRDDKRDTGRIQHEGGSTMKYVEKAKNQVGGKLNKMKKKTHTHTSSQPFPAVPTPPSSHVQILPSDKTRNKQKLDPLFSLYLSIY